MTLAELFPTIQSLSRADKLRLIELLAHNVACEDGIVSDVSDQVIPIWSPHDAFDGAATLLQALDDDKVSF